MLSLNSVGLNIEGKKIFEGISMTFLPSSIVYLKGRNGSGKTSLIRMLAGIQAPSIGSITIGANSMPLADMPKPYCTYIGHKIGLKSEFTVLENLTFWAKAYNSAELIDAALVYFSLNELVNTKCYELSAGNQKKVALARLLACQSKLWLLDEVDSNLDAINKRLLVNLMVSHADSGGIVFISTHNEPEIRTAQTLDFSEYGE